MKKLVQLFIVAVFMIIVGCSTGSDPQIQLKKIDELKNKGFPISSEQMENINRFVDEGKSLMEQGKDQDASKAFAKAIDILNMALDADIFNKAD
jgi:hypothetical protein